MEASAGKIVWAIATGLLFFAAASLLLSPVQAALVGTVTLLVVLWTNEGLPLGVVSLLPIVLFPALHILPTKATTVNYAHPIIYLFLGGFMLAIAVVITSYSIHYTKLYEYLATSTTARLSSFRSSPCL